MSTRNTQSRPSCLSSGIKKALSQEQNSLQYEMQNIQDSPRNYGIYKE